MKQFDEEVENNLQVAQLFEVEELEERVEFGKWEAEAGYNEKDGGYGKIVHKF